MRLTILIWPLQLSVRSTELSEAYTVKTAIEKIRLHLLQQKARSLGVNGDSCKFRSMDGLMCAVGVLIPEERCTIHLEGMSVTYIRQHLIDILKDVPSNVLGMCMYYHDSEAMLAGFAYSYQKWIDGNEDHSPDLFAAAVENAHYRWNVPSSVKNKLHNSTSA